MSKADLTHEEKLSRGKELRAKKATMPVGQWETWCKENAINPRTARRHMNYGVSDDHRTDIAEERTNNDREIEGFTVAELTPEDAASMIRTVKSVAYIMGADLLDAEIDVWEYVREGETKSGLNIGIGLDNEAAREYDRATKLHGVSPLEMMHKIFLDAALKDGYLKSIDDSPSLMDINRKIKARKLEVGKLLGLTKQTQQDE